MRKVKLQHFELDKCRPTFWPRFAGGCCCCCCCCCCWCCCCRVFFPSSSGWNPIVSVNKESMQTICTAGVLAKNPLAVVWQSATLSGRPDCENVWVKIDIARNSLYAVTATWPPFFHTTVSLQPNLARMCELIRESSEPKQIWRTPSQVGLRGVLGSQKFKSPGNVTSCPENQ